jgi:hypothetical protein
MPRRNGSGVLFSVVAQLVLCESLLGCAGSQRPKETETVGLPPWAVGKCQDALKHRDAICGSGSIQGMSDLGPARSAAESRARSELARSLQVRVKAMLKDYQAATPGAPEGDAVSEQHIEDVSKQITDIALSGARLEDTFVSNTGTFWALVVLDTDEFKDSLTHMKGLGEGIRAHIIECADRVFRERDQQKTP